MSLSFETKPTLVAYVTCGDPDLETAREIVLAAIEAGAGVIELGVPFSDPVADGPVIQRASERALRQGTTLEKVLKLAGEIRRCSQVGMIAFSYLNPILKFGLKNFCDAGEEAGLDGALVTDLPVEEADGYLQEMRSRRLSTVFLAAPTSTDHRLRSIAKSSSGFVYAVSRTGVTGAKEALPEDLPALIRSARRATDLPIAVGFGISQPGHVTVLGGLADAAVIGSALVAEIEEAAGGVQSREGITAAAKALHARIRGLKQAAQHGLSRREVAP